ncbi:MAG: MBL fold metallo-hydrolase [Desulfobacteraceae bacterium]|nr:MBL fold metallo-hydrolase [Desulfobacteraceae bacterium]
MNKDNTLRPLVALSRSREGMQFIIHRGARQVGGSCVELNFNDSTILLDIGLPLDSDFSDDPEFYLPQPLFNELKNGKKKIDAAILSHAHLDHYGLAGMLPTGVPVYCGKASAELMAITGQISPEKTQPLELQFFKAWKEFQVGAFSVTPYLMDHSAFDAYGFLISAGGKSLFYTGDFRGHCRKAKLLDHMVQNPPKVNVLWMEGTLVGERTNELTITEQDLENQFASVIKKTPGIVLVTTSSQNIDRLVTIFKATIRTDRKLIIDFYTAEILDRLKPYAKLPLASWAKIRVCYPQLLARRFEKLGLDDILVRHRRNGIKWTRIKEIENNAVMLIRAGFLYDIKRFLGLEGATWIYSLWPGYFERSKPLRNLKSYLEDKGVRYEYMHTSGHAKLEDLKKLVDAMAPEMVIPIHSFHPDKFKDYFPNVRLVNDGEVVNL